MNNFAYPQQTFAQVVNGWSRRGGIYQIKCIKTNRAYLGSTGNIIKRLKQHYKQLKAKTHPNQEMQQDFNQVKEPGFVVEFIKLVSPYYDRKQLYVDEQNYLDVVKSFETKYYNKTHRCKKAEARITKDIQAFIKLHIDPYHCSRLTHDTFEVAGKTKTVISYQFQDQITHYLTLTHN